MLNRYILLYVCNKIFLKHCIRSHMTTSAYDIISFSRSQLESVFSPQPITQIIFGKLGTVLRYVWKYRQNCLFNMRMYRSGLYFITHARWKMCVIGIRDRRVLPFYFIGCIPTGFILVYNVTRGYKRVNGFRNSKARKKILIMYRAERGHIRGTCSERFMSF